MTILMPSGPSPQQWLQNKTNTLTAGGTRRPEPFRTMALVCVCLGLRISECLALKWSDVDWFGGRLRVERGIVCQNAGDVKTRESGKSMSIDDALLATLKTWKQATPFPGNEDWIFASPMQFGGLPWSYPWVWRMFQNAAKAARVGKLSTQTSCQR